MTELEKQLLAVLRECDEAMAYMSEYDIPLTLPDRVKEAIAAAEAAQPAASTTLTVWYGSMPESNGKANWTAILHRKGGCISEGFTLERSEYPGRVKYEADRVRYLIGELETEPSILDYDGDLHSDYVAKEPATTQPAAVPEVWRAAISELLACDGGSGVYDAGRCIKARNTLLALLATPATVKDSLIVQAACPDQFFAYSNEIGFELLNTADEARAFAQQEIDEYRDNAAEGWDEAVEKVRWGIVLGKAEEIPITDHDGNTTDSIGDRFVDYVLSDCAPAQVEQQAPGKWQPISTAPKDGTVVLGALVGSDIPQPVRYVLGGWRLSWDGHPVAFADGPTHWQPLPAAPTQGAGARLAAEAKGGEA